MKTFTNATTIAAAAGIAFFVLQLLAPEPDAGEDGLALTIAGLTWLAFIVFASILRSEVLTRERDGRTRVLADVAFAASVLLAGFGLASVATWIAPVMTGGMEEAVGSSIDAAAVGAWRFFAEATANVLIEAATFWRSLLLIAVAVAALRAAALPAWLAWLSGALGAAALLASVAFLDTGLAELGTTLGFGSSVAFTFWVPLTGLLLAWRNRASE